MVQLDQDVLRLAEFAPYPSALALCDEVHRWLGLGQRKAQVVVALPAPSTDAWLLARVAPELAVEEVTNPKAQLLGLGIAPGAPHYQRAWAGSAGFPGAELAALQSRVPELRRFVAKVAGVLAGRGGGLPDAVGPGGGG